MGHWRSGLSDADCCCSLSSFPVPWSLLRFWPVDGPAGALPDTIMFYAMTSGQRLGERAILGRPDPI